MANILLHFINKWPLFILKKSSTSLFLDLKMTTPCSRCFSLEPKKVKIFVLYGSIFLLKK